MLSPPTEDHSFFHGVVFATTDVRWRGVTIDPGVGRSKGNLVMMRKVHNSTTGDKEKRFVSEDPEELWRRSKTRRQLASLRAQSPEISRSRGARSHGITGRSRKTRASDPPVTNALLTRKNADHQRA